jgi:hypothetical protein
MLKLGKLLKEDEAQLVSPTGNDDLSKAVRSRDIIKHNLLSLTLEDAITNPDKIARLLEQMDKLESPLTKLINKAYDEDEELAEKLDMISAELTVYWNFLSAIETASEKLNNSIKNLNIKV